MKYSLLSLCSLLLFCSTVIQTQAAELEQRTEKRNAPVGKTVVLDFEAFYAKSAYFRMLQGRYKSIQQPIAEQLKTMEDRIKQNMDQLDYTSQEKDPQKYGTLEDTIEVEKLTLKLTQQRALDHIKGVESKMFSEGLADFKKLLALYAEENGIDLVLPAPPKNLTGRKLLDVQTLYHSPRIDITADFTAYANAQFTPPAEAATVDESDVPVIGTEDTETTAPANAK